MTGFKLQVDALEERFRAWAVSRSDIRAAIVVGSRARADHGADEWADLDLGILVDKPHRYLTHHSWLRELGSPIARYLDPSGVTLHVLFEDGSDAGFAFLPVNAFKQAMRILPWLNRYPAVFRSLPGGLGTRLETELTEAASYTRRGHRLLVDKDGLAERFFSLNPSAPEIEAKPSEKEFLDLVGRFSFMAIWTAKHLRRGEIWFAMRNGCDGQLKDMLLQMIEWNERSKRGSLDTWNDGRFIEEWASKEVIGELRHTFGHYESGEVWRALAATIALFRRLSAETAARLGYAYPDEVDAMADRLMTEISESE